MAKTRGSPKTVWANVTNANSTFAKGLAGHEIHVIAINMAELGGNAEVVRILAGSTQKATFNVAANSNSNPQTVSEESPIVIDAGEDLIAITASAANVDVGITYRYV